MLEKTASGDVPFGTVWSFNSLPVKYQIANQISIALLFVVLWFAVRVGLILVTEQDTVIGTYLLRAAYDYAGIIWFLYAGYRWFADGMSGYRVAGDEVSFRKGWLHQVQTSTPLKRIQNIEVVQGVIYRPFGLAELRVLSAGYALKIPGLPLANAECLRMALLKCINGDDDAAH